MKKSINSAQVVGTLSEMNLELATKDVVLGRGTSNEKTVNCRQFSKASYSNPMFTIEVNDGFVGVDFLPISEKKLDEDGKVVDNPRFKSFMTVYENYIPKSKDAENATRVKVDGVLADMGYATLDGTEGKWVDKVGINGFQITSSNVPSEDSSDSEISGIITAMIDEANKNEELTGRLIIELHTVANDDGVMFPLKLFVESDLADDVKNFYEVGDSVKLYYEVVTKTVGATQKSNGGFSRRESKKVSGFTVTEFSLFKGDNRFEEENEYFITVDETVSAKSEREIMKKKKIDERVAKGNTSSNPSPSGMASKNTSSQKNNPFVKGADTQKKNPFA